MRIIFIGNVEFSYRMLKLAIKEKRNIGGLITTKKSNFNSDYKNLSQLAKKKNIPLHYVKLINSDRTKKWIIKKNPDYIFCLGWSQILGKL